MKKIILLVFTGILCSQVVYSADAEREALLESIAAARAETDRLKQQIAELKQIADGVPVSGDPESQFFVISRADLDYMRTQLEDAVTNGVKKAYQKDPEPRWQRLLGFAWAGVKLPYQILMMVPAEVRVLVILYFTLKFKPEVFGWAFKYVVKNSPGLGAFLMEEFGIPMAEEMSHVIADATKVNIAEFVPGVVVNGAATVTTAAAESAAQLANTWIPEWLQGFALSLGY